MYGNNIEFQTCMPLCRTIFFFFQRTESSFSEAGLGPSARNRTEICTTSSLWRKMFFAACPSPSITSDRTWTTSQSSIQFSVPPLLIIWLPSTTEAIQGSVAWPDAHRCGELTVQSTISLRTSGLPPSRYLQSPPRPSSHRCVNSRSQLSPAWDNCELSKGPT